MYKIYINNTLVKLKRSKPNRPNKANELIARYAGTVKHLHNFVDLAEKGGKDYITLYHDDYDKLKSDFKGLFNIVPAAGGLVTCENGEMLFIYRRAHWDLPKGKIEKAEKRKEAAIREVEEETGVSGLELKEKICVTRHVYKNRAGKRCIKKSYWYHMEAPRQDLIPQTEEDIEKAIWCKPSEILDQDLPIFDSIVDVLRKYEKQKSKKLNSMSESES